MNKVKMSYGTARLLLKCRNIEMSPGMRQQLQLIVNKEIERRNLAKIPLLRSKNIAMMKGS